MKPIMYRVAYFLLKPYTKIVYKPTIIGKENIPTNEPVILAGNHTSKKDSFIIGSATKKDLYYIVKSELHDTKLKKALFTSLGTIPVNRKSKNNKSSLNHAMELLKEDKIIVIFPEGTINKTDDIIMPFKFGAVSLASKTNAKIVPFAIKNKFVPFKKSITIVFGKPYTVSSDLEKENKKLEEKVIKLLKENINEKH